MRPLVTFDAYTALVDCERGLVPAIESACPGADARSLARAWRAKQLEYAQISNSLQGDRIPFRTVTRRALDYTFARAGIALAPAQADSLMGAWDRLPPWPEAKPMLSTLKDRGYVLAILSNGDADMLHALARSFDGAFDHILASDQAGHYKPHPAMYRLPTSVLGIAAGDVLHVAGSSTDVLGAKRAGLACAWSNRQGDRMLDPGVRPDYEMRDLGGLAGILP